MSYRTPSGETLIVSAVCDRFICRHEVSRVGSRESNYSRLLLADVVTDELSEHSVDRSAPYVGGGDP